MTRYIPTKMNPPLINHRQELFIQGIVNGKCQAEAYLDAGYKPTSKQTGYTKSSELIRKDYIAAEIKRRRELLAVKCDIKSEEIIDELKGMALSNITDVMSWDEHSNITIFPSETLSEQVKKAIKRVKCKSRHYAATNSTPAYIESEIDVEMHTKEGPLKQLGEYLGLWDEKAGNTVVINKFLTNIQNKYGMTTAK